MTDNKESIGISVSEFYNFYIILHHFNWSNSVSKTYNGITTDETIENEIREISFEVEHSSNEVLHITYENINHVVSLMIKKVLELNEELYKKVKEGMDEETFKKTYSPVGRIIFTDTESAAPIDGFEVIGKLKKDFYVRFALYKIIDKIANLPNINELEKMLKQAIITDLLDVVEELKEEETFTPPTSFLKKFESIGIKS